MKRLFYAVLLFACAFAHATDISVVGLFPGKAVLVIDGKAPRTYSVGNTVAPDIRLLEVDQNSAIFETNGKRERIALGHHINRNKPSTNASITLRMNHQGHFVVQGQINGGMAQMLIDTGASAVSLPASDAKRFGIDYRSGKAIQIHTANGVTNGWLVTLNSVRIGDITLNQVEGVVQESGLSVILLGMSFLNRMDLRRNGEEMVLTKRY